jgi:chromosome segregation ATPase
LNLTKLKLVSTILFFLVTANLFAQQNNALPDSIATKQIQHAKQKLKNDEQKLSQFNIVRKDSTKIDSLKSAEKLFSDSLHSSNVASDLKAKEQHIMDSITIPVKRVSGAVSGAENRVNQEVSKLNSLPKTLESKLNLQNDVKAKEDSLQRGIGNLNKKLSGVESKIQNNEDSLQNKLTSGVTKVAGKAEGKINSMTGEKINIPGTKNFNSPNEKVPNTSLSEINTKLPGADTKLPELNTNLNTQLPDAGNLNVAKQVSEIKTDIPSLNTPKLDQLDKIDWMDKVLNLT